MNFTLQDVISAGKTTKRGIHLWDQKGILGPVERDKRGARIFTEEHMRRVKIAAIAQLAGWPLARIRALVNTPSSIEIFNLRSDLFSRAEEINLADDVLVRVLPEQEVFDL